MKSSNPVIVVGAGLVGTLWTIFLARRGYQVEVYERRPDMRRVGYTGGRSINLAMSVRGWTALEKAGIRQRIEQTAIPMYGRMMHDLEGKLTFQPYGEEGQAIYSVSRGGLNLELLHLADAYENVCFHFEHRCVDVDLEQPLITFEDLRTGKYKTIEAPLIFGADGAFSAVRYVLQRTDRFNYAQHYIEHGYKELTIPPGANGRHQMEVNALHIWPRKQFMLIALPNIDGSFTCTLFLPFEGNPAFEQLNTDEAVTDFFKCYFPDAVPLMPTLLEDFRRNPTSSLVTTRCYPWQWQGRILLIGDAAHAIVPFYGQGMNAGFEDCTILDAMYDEYGGDWSRILPAFSAQRKKDGDAILELALRNFVEMRDLVADPKFLLRKKIAARLHERHPEFLPVYSMVSFSTIPYHVALQEDDRQNELFERILAIPDIEQKWDSQEVERVFLEWFRQHRLEEHKEPVNNAPSGVFYTL
ncbi:MAG: FAD-dependent monooxygenase [Saprospiraceae bacterium]|nr:FAD-dependent monooxygenase [Saprospiraceae bacterium]MDW8485103.1 NAD(P)/FAD-dependent oxidoreductase [Saprospiraceae bacterium]